MYVDLIFGLSTVSIIVMDVDEEYSLSDVEYDGRIPEAGSDSKADVVSSESVVEESDLEEEPGIAEKPGIEEEIDNFKEPGCVEQCSMKRRVDTRTWEKIDLEDAGEPVPVFTFKHADQVGATSIISADVTPLDFYGLFLTSDMMKDLATSSNAYPKARRNNWTEVKERDLIG